MTIFRCGEFQETDDKRYMQGFSACCPKDTCLAKVDYQGQKFFAELIGKPKVLTKKELAQDQHDHKFVSHNGIHAMVPL